MTLRYTKKSVENSSVFFKKKRKLSTTSTSTLLFKLYIPLVLALKAILGTLIDQCMLRKEPGQNIFKNKNCLGGLFYHFKVFSF